VLTGRLLEPSGFFIIRTGNNLVTDRHCVYHKPMADLQEQSLLGKKVFFVYPPSVIQKEMISLLLEQEFEIYMVKDHQSAKRLLKLYPDCIAFINIDAGMAEKEWDSWIRDMLADPVTATIGIGILSYNTDDELRKKYLMDIGIRCGFVRLKIGIEQSASILIETLKANEAKGRRKYLRAACGTDALTGLNVNYAGKLINGKIKDISVVGLSCVFETDPFFPKNAVIGRIQLKLRGTLVLVDAVVFGTRQEDGNTVYVLLFTQKIDGVTRTKIRSFIQTALQTEMDLVALTGDKGVQDSHP